MRIVSHMFTGVLMVVALGVTALSVLFAARFGHSLGHTEIMRLAFGTAAGGLDVMKAILPIIAVGIFWTPRPFERRCIWVVFAVLVCMSMMATVGNLASQSQSKGASKVAEVSKRDRAQGTLDRLIADRKALPSFTPTSAEAVDAARKAVEAAERTADQECQNGRGSRCRAREEDARQARTSLAHTVENRTPTVKAEALDARIAEAEKALGAVDDEKIAADADPLAATLAAVLGTTIERAALFREILWAIAIEAVSGVGLMLAFRNLHAKPEDHYEEIAAEEPVSVEPGIGRDDPIFGSPTHFFREMARKVEGRRVVFGTVYDRYVAFCAKISVEPLSKTKFSREAAWTKSPKVGGEVYFLDIELIDAREARVIPLRR